MKFKKWLWLAVALAALTAKTAPAQDEPGVLVYPLDVDVSDMFLMLTVTLPEEREKARRTLDGKIEAHVEKQLGMPVIVFPEMTSEESAQFNRTMRLFKRVGGTIRSVLDPDVKVKDYPAAYENFSYSVGSGAEFLAQKTGARFLLVFDAQMLIPYSASTVAAVNMRMSDLTYIYAALIDLHNGRIVWFNSANDDKDLRKESDVEGLLNELFRNYPSSDYYKSVADNGGAVK